MNLVPRRTLLLLSFFLWISVGLGATPQDGPPVVRALTTLFSGQQQQRLRAPSRRDHYRTIFDDVQRGLESGDIKSFSEHLAPQVQVNLRGGESGYYSADQAYYLLEDYFRTRRLVNLSFTTIGESDANPYATGGAGFAFKGSREYVQVYVALTQAGDRWVISRINIY